MKHKRSFKWKLKTFWTGFLSTFNLFPTPSALSFGTLRKRPMDPMRALGHDMDMVLKDLETSYAKAVADTLRPGDRVRCNGQCGYTHSHCGGVLVSVDELNASVDWDDGEKESMLKTWLEHDLPCPHSRPNWRMCPHCNEFS